MIEEVERKNVKNVGRTRDRTWITGIRIRCANHYTIQPFCINVLLLYYLALGSIFALSSTRYGQYPILTYPSMLSNVLFPISLVSCPQHYNLRNLSF
jgi:hypothetical protein